MTGKKDDKSDDALWQAQLRGVRPLVGRGRGAALPKRRRIEPRLPDDPLPLPHAMTRAAPIVTSLDRSWAERIRRGRIEVERSIDLHGLDRDTAYLRLIRFIAEAKAQGARILLVITGKGREAPRLAGVLKQSVPDWLAASPYAGDIMAVTGAHKIHGGDGALYVILRRGG